MVSHDIAKRVLQKVRESRSRGERSWRRTVKDDLLIQPYRDLALGASLAGMTQIFQRGRFGAFSALQSGGQTVSDG